MLSTCDRSSPVSILVALLPTAHRQAHPIALGRVVCSQKLEVRRRNHLLPHAPAQPGPLRRGPLATSTVTCNPVRPAGAFVSHLPVHGPISRLRRPILALMCV